MLQDYVTEQNHLYDKDSRDAQDVPRAPLGSQGYPGQAPGTQGTLLGPPGTPLGLAGTPLGPPGTPLGARGPRWTTKMAISQQVYSARSFRLLCSNLLAAAHCLNDSPGPFCL